jgi:hypothetical protein
VPAISRRGAEYLLSEPLVAPLGRVGVARRDGSNDSPRDVRGVGLGRVDPASMSVSMPPGYAPDHLVPRSRTSARNAWVNECAAAFEAEYPAIGPAGARAISVRMLTIAAGPFDSSIGTNARVTRTVPR